VPTCTLLSLITSLETCRVHFVLESCCQRSTAAGPQHSHFPVQGHTCQLSRLLPLVPHFLFTDSVLEDRYEDYPQLQRLVEAKVKQVGCGHCTQGAPSRVACMQLSTWADNKMTAYMLAPVTWACSPCCCCGGVVCTQVRDSYTPPYGLRADLRKLKLSKDTFGCR
jgi:hypothetical protein